MIRLIDTVEEVEQKVILELKKVLNLAFNRVKKDILIDIQNSLLPIFQQTETYNALVNGPLDAHFGFHKGTSKGRVDRIVSELQKQVFVRFKSLNNQLKGGLEINIIENDFIKIISLPESHTITEKGKDLPWLEWMLIRGNEIIINNYDIKFINDPRSRSGKALMVHSDSGSWSVPVEYSGVINDNWITRSLDEILPELSKIFEEIIKRNLERVL